MRKRISYVICPKCEVYTFQKILFTRVNEDDHRTLRRRCCEECNHKWNTIQEPEKTVDNISEREFLIGGLLKKRVPIIKKI